MAGVVGSRRDLIFVISELYYEVGGRYFVVGSKIAGCWHILTGLLNCRQLGLYGENSGILAKWYNHLYKVM